MKVIVIANNPFSKYNNNGKTLEAIFSCFNKEELCQLFFRPVGNDIDWDFCKSFFLVTDQDLVGKFIHPFRSVVGREIVKDNVSFDETNLAKTPGNAFSWKRLTREYLWKTRLWKTRALDEWLNRENPDLIFFVGGNSAFAYDVVDYIKKSRKLNVVTFFTDDYIIHPIYPNAFSRMHLKMLKKKYVKIISESTRKYCIGEQMANEYSNYYNTSFGSVMNLIDVGVYRPKENTHHIFRKISYFGGLHLNRWTVISRLASLLPSGLELHVYTFQPIDGQIKESFDNAHVIYHDGVTGDNLSAAISDSDALLHVESDDPHYKAITMLSVSTKIPEYLEACRPVLAVGPTEVASIRLIKDNKVGFVIDSTLDDTLVSKILSDFVNNELLRDQIVYNGYRFVKANFDKKIIAHEFRNEMTIFSQLNKGFVAR